MPRDNYITSGHIKYASKKKRIKSSNNFTQKEVKLSDTPLFFPEGFEKIFLAIYFISLPYIAGLLFLFFYVAEGKPELFASLSNNSSFILTWCIGYEVLAAIILLSIIKSAISFSLVKRNKFERP